MAQLDQWSDAKVIGPLYVAAQDLGDDFTPEDWDLAVQPVLKAIREKVLESYRNGQAAGIRPVRKETRRYETRAH